MSCIIRSGTVGVLLVSGLLAGAILGGGSAYAQNDIAGEWSGRLHEDLHHRRPGPELGDYTGIPVNDASRLKADSWVASILTLREHQAKPHPSTYSLRGPASISIRRIVHPVTQDLVAYELFGTFGQATRLIWMDGRPHPPAHAPHTWAGFSTGAWDGHMLRVYTTHSKVGWLQRNGVANSDQATMVEHFIRHGNYLTAVTVVDDPIYLEEPFIRTTNWVLNPSQQVRRTQFDVVDEIAARRRGYVPHLLPGSPGAQLRLTEFPSRHGISTAGARGGAATTYPEYRYAGASATGVAPSPGRRPADPAPAPDGGIQVLPVQGNVHMLVGAGANITVQVGPDGVLVVDAGLAEFSDQVLAAIRELSDEPLRIVINTHLHPDHAGANDALTTGGTWLGGRAPGNGYILPGTRVLAHENVIRRMSATTPADLWPTETFFGEDKELFFNGEAIRIIHVPGHTDGDVLVFFRRSDVVSAGDLFTTTAYPVIDVENGGSVAGLLEGLNRVIDLAIPHDPAEGGTYVVPGHGRVSDEIDVVEYRDMLTIVRDRVQDAIDRGLTLAEILAAGLTLDYDGRYGSDNDLWTTSMFVDTVYRELSRQ